MLSASYVSGHVTQTLFTTSMFDLAAYPHPSYYITYGTGASFELHLNDAVTCGANETALYYVTDSQNNITAGMQIQTGMGQDTNFSAQTAQHFS